MQRSKDLRVLGVGPSLAAHFGLSRVSTDPRDSVLVCGQAYLLALWVRDCGKAFTC